jgi:hypothetical protein
MNTQETLVKVGGSTRKGATTFSIKALSIMTLSVMGLFATLRINVTQHK